MSYQIIPFQPVANSQFRATLDDVVTQITLTTTDYGLYADIVCDGSGVNFGQLVLDRTDINPNRYRGLPQGLFVVDTLGTTDPDYTGFGTRYVLIYGDPGNNGGTFVPDYT